MAKKQSKSARIRKLLDQGKSVKQIVGMLGVTPQFVYTIRAQEKKKWVMVETSTSKKPIGIPKDVYEEHMIPTDYYQPKPSLLARIKNFFLGA